MPCHHTDSIGDKKPKPISFFKINQLSTGLLPKDILCICLQDIDAKSCFEADIAILGDGHILRTEIMMIRMKCRLIGKV